MSFLRVIRQTRSARTLLAGAFLFVLVAEWGSHAIVCSDEFQVSGAQAFSATDRGHEDPCQSLVMCSDSKQKDHQTPSFSHDASQHNGLVDVFAALRPRLSAISDAPIDISSATRIYRPPKPPYHPPKQA